MIPVFRFAPSPNGRLHLGHAYSAWWNVRLADLLAGRFLLRIEDIDVTRCTEELAEVCLEDLAWLGFNWEEPVRVQSEHWDDYQAAFETLQYKDVVYPCFCSRKQIAEAAKQTDPDGAPLYPGTCRAVTPQEARQRIAAGEEHAWRLKMAGAINYLGEEAMYYARFDPATGREEPVKVDPAKWGDAVIVRKEIPTSYHLSVVVDDALQGITHVVRGQDLEAATDLHVLLQQLLELPTPYYFHHDLISDDGGEKLDKSRGSESLADMRERGITPQEIFEIFED